MVLRYRPKTEADGRNDAAYDVVLWARSILKVDGDTVVSIARHRCGDPRCAEGATTILLMRPDSPAGTVRIEKPLEAITESDLRVALKPLLTPNRQSTRPPPSRRRRAKNE
jgi:hypothetical protein